jgi:hypothetical protein
VVLSAFVLLLMSLYTHSSDSFKITLWKQERAAQSEIFWAYMRKHLEEATNELVVEAAVENPEITINLKPFKFHPNANAVGTGNVAAWNCSTVKFNFVPAPNHTVEHRTCILFKKKNVLELRANGKIVAKLEDISAISFKVTSIKKLTGNEESLEAGFDPDAVGTIIEISLTLSPPENYMAKDLKIAQNHKFRMNVGATSDPSPAY